MTTRGRRSAGLLLFRRDDRGAVEVLVAHMGGPYWRTRDAGAWSLPKGEHGPEEDALAAARREFREELGLEPPDGPFVPLGDARQSGGKVVTAWAVEADLDPASVRPGTFELEWPPRSGRTQAFPEVDRVEWVDVPTARVRLVRGQAAFLDALERWLRSS